MGYLSQKKFKIRENISLHIAAVIFAIIALILFFNPEFTLFRLNLFHFYCLSIIFMIWAIAAHKIIPSLVIFIACVISYTQLSIAGNIFLSDNYNGSHSHNISYSDSLKINKADAKGELFFGKNEFAQYAIINGDSPLLIVRIDLAPLSRDKYSVILKELHKFIVKQDMPVVLFGNFNMPSWAKPFRRFSEYSGLNVKNRLIFSNSKEKGLFAIPHFYILGFSHMGIDNLRVHKGNISVNINYDII